MKITHITQSDVHEIVPCAREFCAIIPDTPLNETHYINQWTAFLSNDRGMIMVMRDEAGVVIGGIGGVIHPDLLTAFSLAIELFWYVKPEFRYGIWGVKLLKEFEKWAGENRCHYIHMIHMQCSMPEEMKHFYERMGYHLFETIYRKKIK